MSDNTTEDPKVLAIQIKNMSDLLERHEKNTAKQFDKIDERFTSLETMIRNFHDKAEDRYVTKEKFEVLETDVSDIQNEIERVSWSVIGTFFTLLIAVWTWVVNKLLK